MTAAAAAFVCVYYIVRKVEEAAAAAVFSSSQFSVQYREKFFLSSLCTYVLPQNTYTKDTHIF